MFSLFTAPLTWAARKLLGSFVDSFVSTPLDTDFGDSDPFEGNGYEADFLTTLHPVALADVLEALSAKYRGGVRQDAITRAVRRVSELRLNHSAHLFFQVSSSTGTSEELRVDLHKDNPEGCSMTFSGSQQVIDYIQQIDNLLADVNRKLVPASDQHNRVR